MSAELAEQNSSASSAPTSAQNSNGDTYIFVPVSVRMDGQKMQLDFKVDSKTLAAAEQLRMAVVRSGVVETKPSTSAAGKVSDRTKSALRKIVGPNKFQIQQNSGSYSSPATPGGGVFFDEEIMPPKKSGGATTAKSSTSKVKNARTLLAEKLRKSKQQQTPILVNGESSASAKKFKTADEIHHPQQIVHSTPSSPLFAAAGFNQQKHQQFQNNFDLTTTSICNSLVQENNRSSSFFSTSPYGDVVDLVDVGFPTPDDVFSTGGTPQLTQLTNGAASDDVMMEYGRGDEESGLYFQQLTNLSLPPPPAIPANQTSAPPPDVSANQETDASHVRDSVDAVVASCRVGTSAPDLKKEIVAAAAAPVRHRPNRSKSTPSAMCGFVNTDGDKQCRQRCINGFKFCIRHILNDADAPYHPCAYVKTQGSKQIKCNNAVPNHQETEFCGTHLIMKGLRQPKIRKKKKEGVGNNSDNNNCLPQNQSSVNNVNELDQHDVDYYQADAQVYSSNNNNNTPSTNSTATANNTNNVNHHHPMAVVHDSSAASVANNVENHLMGGRFYSLDSQVSNDIMAVNENYGYSPHYGTSSNNFCHQQQQPPPSFNSQQRSSSTASSSSANLNNNCFDFVAVGSRPESQLSAGVSPYLNGYIHLHSPPQSPWKMPSTPNTQQQNGGGSQNGVVSSSASSSSTPNIGSDLARSHPELLSKLASGSDTGSRTTMSSGNGGGQGLRAFANMVTSAMFEDSNSSYGGGNGAGLYLQQPQHPSNNSQQMQLQRPQHYMYNGNPLMLGDDPFLGPALHPSLLTNDNSSSAAIVSTPVGPGANVMPSPVPSDLSVESVGSHMSSGFQPSSSYPLTNSIHRPSPPVSGYQTPSPSIGGNFGAMHCYSGGVSSFFGGPLAASPSSSSMNYSAGPMMQHQHLLPGSHVSSVSIADDLSSSGHLPSQQQQQQQQPQQLQYTSSRQQFAALTSSSNGGGTVNKDAQVLHHQSIAFGGKNESAKPSAATTTPAVAVVPLLKNAAGGGGNNVATTSKSVSTSMGNSTANGKPKKVIRLKPKKRRMKMMGKYRQIPAVGQMCRVIEDLQFDKTDLFPLGLEPSSSDSENEDDTKPFLPFVDGFYYVTNEIDDDQAAKSKNESLTCSVVSAARRQLYMLKKSLSFSNKELRKKNLETKFVGAASRYYPNCVGNALVDCGEKEKPARNLKTKKLSSTQIQRQNSSPPASCRRCTYESTTTDSQVKCTNECLPYCNSCLLHVLHNVDQQLFRYCTTDGCRLPSVDVGYLPSDTPRCPAHQDRNAYRAIGKLKLEVDDQATAKKKVYKSRYIAKKHRRRRNKPPLLSATSGSSGTSTSYFSAGADERARRDAQDANLTSEMTEEDDDQSEKEDDSNQAAQAALASVARDFGFGGHDLSDILVRMPDATLIENILGQEFSSSSSSTRNVAVEPLTAAKEEMDSIDRALLTATSCDHNWADVEQFLMEENYKSTSDFQVPTTTCSSNVVNGPVPASHHHHPPATFAWPQQQATTRLLSKGGVVMETLPSSAVGGKLLPPEYNSPAFVLRRSSLPGDSSRPPAHHQDPASSAIAHVVAAAATKSSRHSSSSSSSPLQRW